MGELLGDEMGVRLDGRVVIVTGATGGIGSAIVRRLGSAGATVLAAAHTVPASSIAGAASQVEADLRSADAPARTVSHALEAHGRIDGLVNCAAIQPVLGFTEMTDEAWSEMIDTNLTATHRLTKAVAEAMIDEGHGGSIIHIASIEGTHPAVGHSHYSVAKAGVLMHAKAAAVELGTHDIRVNTVSPGLIDRPGLIAEWPEGVSRWKSRAPLTRLGTGDDVADACLFLLSPMAAWITGTDLVVDGGMSAGSAW